MRASFAQPLPWVAYLALEPNKGRQQPKITHPSPQSQSQFILTVTVIVTINIACFGGGRLRYLAESEIIRFINVPNHFIVRFFGFRTIVQYDAGAKTFNIYVFFDVSGSPSRVNLQSWFRFSLSQTPLHILLYLHLIHSHSHNHRYRYRYRYRLKSS